MDPNGRVSHETAVESPPLRRRLSMEEDYFYQEVMTLRRPSQPPPYESAIRKPLSATAKGKAVALEEIVEDEVLPPYSCDIHVEGAFQMKMEIEDATKRAEYRNWHTVFVVLHGTALNVYKCKKDWGLGRTRSSHGPNVSPDNPPWLKKTELEKSYSLLHADVGIAADYHKRRYVIRVRAETDQFLLSCVELGSFVKWLEALFAAIDVAVPIEDRDFPRDQSIPRIQRLRWFRGQDPTPANTETFPRLTNQLSQQQSEAPPASTGGRATSNAPALATPTAIEVPLEAPEPEPEAGPSNQATPRRLDPIGRLSTTSYPNEAIDAETGKWSPRHKWTERHDQVYAKLCYSILLFKSPRKSNYIIMKGKQWFVDWTTGTMRRVFPPGYEDPDYFFGPWQIIHTENSRI